MGDSAKGATKSAPSLLSTSDPAGDKGSLMFATNSMMVLAKSKQSISPDLEANNPGSNETTNAGSSGNSSKDVFKLKPCTKVLIGSGHILNDLCASLWYSYLLLYFQSIVRFNSTDAASLLLLGQIIDGFATPVVGYLTDTVRNCCMCKRNYGRCKSWHLIGSILVATTFPFIFSECPGCTDAKSWIKMIYYGFFIAVFQIGWAMNQISHLALIPKLNPDDIIRTELLAIRNSFNIVTNLAVFVMTWVAFLKTASGCEQISSDDAPKFRYIVLIAVCIGIGCTLLFHIMVKEVDDDVAQRALLKEGIGSIFIAEKTKEVIPIGFPDSLGDLKNNDKADIITDRKDEDAITSNNVSKSEKGSVIIPAVVLTSLNEIKAPEPKKHNSHKPIINEKYWLKNGQFYIVMCIYMCTRLGINVTLTYLPLYLQDDLLLPAETVATVPLTMYISGLIVSFCTKCLNKKLGRLLSYSVGVTLRVVGSVFILYFDWSPGGFFHKIGIFIVAALLGGGASIILVTTMAIVADLIGTHFETGAFIYGCMSFAEKIACGLLIMVINLFATDTNHKEMQTKGNRTEDCVKVVQNTFYRNALGYSCGVSVLVGLFAVILRYYCIKINTKEQNDTNK